MSDRNYDVGIAGYVTIDAAPLSGSPDNTIMIAVGSAPAPGSYSFQADRR